MIRSATMPGTSGTIRLVKIAGIQVYLHWSWFLVALYEIQYRNRYASLTWSILEYLSLFAIVTLHEFGHALACRQVGGRAEQIVLWPLGGVAYVKAPPRPGATLWSIAAGPLVNVALIPVFGIALLLNPSTPSSDFRIFLVQLNLINIGLLIFNILPIYPLDGGQIMRSVLWYAVGRARSLMFAAIVGFLGVAGLGLLALVAKSVWFGVLALFVGMQCVNGYRQAQALSKLAKAPRHEGFACPSCGANPPRLTLWICGSCMTAVDTFEVQALCPRCNTHFANTVCPDCGEPNPYPAWIAAGTSPSRRVSEIKSAAPSIVPVVLGSVAMLGAFLFLLGSVGFFMTASDLKQEAGNPRPIEGVSAGLDIPSEQTLQLEGDRTYRAYIEADIPGIPKLDDIKLDVTAEGTGMPVDVTKVEGTPLQMGHITVLAVASFSIPRTGRYILLVTPGSLNRDASRIRIANAPPGAREVRVTRGLAIGALAITLLLAAGALLLFFAYVRRRRAFHRFLEQMDKPDA
jgi:Zn-dependent protease